MKSEAIKRESSLFVKIIQIYQWIFCIFGLSLPPTLYKGNVNRFKRYLIFIIYIVYCIILFCLTLYTNHIHNKLALIRIRSTQIDCITITLSYSHNVALIIVNGFMEFTTIWRYPDVVGIMNLIEIMDNECSRPESFIIKGKYFKSKLFRNFGIWLVVWCMLFMYATYCITGGNLMDVAIKIIISFFVLTVQIKCIEYALYLQIVHEFIDRARKSLKNLKTQLENKPTSRDDNIPWHFIKQLKHNQQYLSRLWFLANEINKYFAGPILLLFYNNGIAILYTFNWAYLSSLFESNHINLFSKFEYQINIYSKH